MKNQRSPRSYRIIHFTKTCFQPYNTHKKDLITRHSMKRRKKFLYKSLIRTFSHPLNPPEDRIPKKPVIKKKKKQFESCILYYNRDEFEIISKSDVLFYRSRWCVITHGIPITCDIHCKRKLHFTMDILCFYFSDYKIRFIFLESSTMKKNYSVVVMKINVFSTLQMYG